MQYLEWSEVQSTEDTAKIAFFHCISCQQQWHEIFYTNSIGVRDCNGVNCDNKVLPHTIKKNGFGEFKCFKCDYTWIHDSIQPNELKVCTKCGIEVSPLNIYADLESTTIVKHDPPSAGVWSKWLETTDEYFDKHHISGIFNCEMCNVTMNSLHLLVFHATVFHTNYGKRKIELIQGEAPSKLLLTSDYSIDQNCLHNNTLEPGVPVTEVSCNTSFEFKEPINPNLELFKSIDQDTKTLESEVPVAELSFDPSNKITESQTNQNTELDQSSDPGRDTFESELPFENSSYNPSEELEKLQMNKNPRLVKTIDPKAISIESNVLVKSSCNPSKELEESQINQSSTLDQSIDQETNILESELPIAQTSYDLTEGLEEPQINQNPTLDQSIDQETNILESEVPIAQTSCDLSEEFKEPQINPNPGLIKYKGPSISRGWQAWCQTAEELSQIHSFTGTFTCMVCKNDSLINPRLLAHHVASHAHTVKRLKLEGKPDPSVHQPNKNMECNSFTPVIQPCHQFSGHSYMRGYQGSHVTYKEGLFRGLLNQRRDLSQEHEYRRDHMRDSRDITVGSSNYKGGHCGSHPIYGVSYKGNSSNYVENDQDYWDGPPASPVQKPFPPPSLNRNIPYQKPSVFQKSSNYQSTVNKQSRGLNGQFRKTSLSRQSESSFQRGRTNFNFMIGSRRHIPPFPF